MNSATTAVSASAPLDAEEWTPAAGAAWTHEAGEAAPPAAERRTRVPAPEERARLALSFEVIPPRTPEARAKLPELVTTLEGYAPDYVAITSSQNSGWAAGTRDFVREIASTTRLRPLAHITCVGAPRLELIKEVDRFVDAGVRGFLAIRGDLSAGQSAPPPGYLAHANDLVGLIRGVEQRDFAKFAAGRLAVGVAAYPAGHAESTGLDEDIDVLLAKQRAGADFAITQLFYNVDDYALLKARAARAGAYLPIIPGILPLTSAKRLERMSGLSGLTPPRELTAALAAASPAEQREIGLTFTANLAKDLLAAGAPGLHFYTFNDPRVVTDLVARIDLDHLINRKASA